MTGSLTHSPGDVIRHMLIDLGLGTLPSGDSTWPIFCPSEPDSPDSVITVRTTGGRDGGRFQTDGERQGHPGIQIRVRSHRPDTGWEKANAVAVALDAIANQTVPISDNTYTVYAVTIKGNVIPIGPDSSKSERFLFAINATVSLRDTTS